VGRFELKPSLQELHEEGQCPKPTNMPSGQPAEESCWDLVYTSWTTLQCEPLNKNSLWSLPRSSLEPVQPPLESICSPAVSPKAREENYLPGKIYWDPAAAHRGHREHSQCCGATNNKHLQPHQRPYQWGHLDKTLHLCITKDCKFWGHWERGTLQVWMGWCWQAVSTNSRGPT
jgi:hypothetical protein